LENYLINMNNINQDVAIPAIVRANRKTRSRSPTLLGGFDQDRSPGGRFPPIGRPAVQKLRGTGPNPVKTGKDKRPPAASKGKGKVRDVNKVIKDQLVDEVAKNLGRKDAESQDSKAFSKIKMDEKLKLAEALDLYSEERIDAEVTSSRLDCLASSMVKTAQLEKLLTDHDFNLQKMGAAKDSMESDLTVETVLKGAEVVQAQLSFATATRNKLLAENALTELEIELSNTNMAALLARAELQAKLNVATHEASMADITEQVALLKMGALLDEAKVARLQASGRLREFETVLENPTDTINAELWQQETVTFPYEVCSYGWVEEDTNSLLFDAASARGSGNGVFRPFSMFDLIAPGVESVFEFEPDSKINQEHGSHKYSEKEYVRTTEEVLDLLADSSPMHRDNFKHRGPKCAARERVSKLCPQHLDMLEHVKICDINPADYVPSARPMEQLKLDCINLVDRHVGTIGAVALTTALAGLFAPAAFASLASSCATAVSQTVASAYKSRMFLASAELRAVPIRRATIAGDNRPQLDRGQKISDSVYVMYKPFVLLKYSNGDESISLNPNDFGLSDWAFSPFSSNAFRLNTGNATIDWVANDNPFDLAHHTTNPDLQMFRNLVVNTNLLNAAFQRKTLAVRDVKLSIERAYRVIESLDSQQEMLGLLIKEGVSTYKDTLKFVAAKITNDPHFDGDF
jgi:hypothetical protein